MNVIKIKPQYAKKIIAFGGSGKVTLAERTQLELTKLAVTAVTSGDQTILNLFEGELPPLSEMQKKLTETAIAKK